MLGILDYNLYTWKPGTSDQASDQVNNSMKKVLNEEKQVKTAYQNK